jgi:hypothetical protein
MSRRNLNKYGDMEGFFRIYSNGVKIAEFKDNLKTSKKQLDKFLKQKIQLDQEKY